MCLVLSLILLTLAYTLFEDGNMQGGLTSLAFAIFFIILLIRNILKIKKQRDKS